MKWEINEKNLKELAEFFENISEEHSRSYYLHHLTDFFISKLQDDIQSIKDIV